MKKQGTVVRWDEAKGFGFIKSPQSNAQLFFHIREWRGNGTPGHNQRVSFEEIHVGGKGPRAMDVRPESDSMGSPTSTRTAERKPATGYRQPSHRTTPPNRPNRAAASRPTASAGPALLLMLVWAGLLVGGIVIGRLSGWFLPAAVALNLLTFYVYWQDKHAAATGQWRISEKNLHYFGLLGGWPGAWFAHQVLRHKSSKQAFRAVYWLTALANLTALAVWVLLPWLNQLR